MVSQVVTEMSGRSVSSTLRMRWAMSETRRLSDDLEQFSKRLGTINLARLLARVGLYGSGDRPAFRGTELCVWGASEAGTNRR